MYRQAEQTLVNQKQYTSQSQYHNRKIRYLKHKAQKRRHRKRVLRCMLLGESILLLLSFILLFHFANSYRFPISLWHIDERAQSVPLAPDEETTNPSDTAQIQTEEPADLSWQLILVNRWHTIPEDYLITLVEFDDGIKVDARISPALQEMLDAARKDDVYPKVVSGYRTQDKQQALLDDKTQAYKNEGYEPEEANELAQEWVALPGTSEHQLGIAVDINGDGIHSTGDEVYDWLNENASLYGFIRRYPPDKTELTGVINEPWHYRYVGKAAAKEIHENGICLEEYLNQTQ